MKDKTKPMAASAQNPNEAEANPDLELTENELDQVNGGTGLTPEVTHNLQKATDKEQAAYEAYLRG